MNKDFVAFQKHFLHYRKLLGMTDYKVYFKYESIGDCFADITLNRSDMIATVRLNNEVKDKDKKFHDIKGHAKHEAIHLLLHPLESAAMARYVTEDEVRELAEGLTHRLEELIP